LEIARDGRGGSPEATPLRRGSERVRLNQVGWDTDLVHELDGEPLPAPTGAEVLVRVEACGVCHRDLIDRAGRWPFLRTPITPGHEAAGRVVAVGPAVRDFRVGDRVGTMHRDACGVCASCLKGETSICAGGAWVFGIMADGGYAANLLAPESALYALPATMPAPEAAVMHCTYGTAYRDLKTLGKVAPRERVLITGANGGVGLAAVQIAARLGAEVVAVVRSAAHTELLTRLGAHRVVVDDGTTFHEQSAAAGIDLVLEAVGHSTFASSLKTLRLGGRMVIVGNIVPERVALNLGALITRGLTLIGGSGATRNDMAELLALHRAKPFEVNIDRVLPLSQADAAQRLVRAGGLKGRIVLVPSG
jgi:D-arabinose 1-dehydrogenase-like Zn-dependent alcohol dehydrogenase